MTKPADLDAELWARVLSIAVDDDDQPIVALPNEVAELVRAGVSSPIEILMLAALLRNDGKFIPHFTAVGVGLSAHQIADCHLSFLSAQAPLDPFRVDFLIGTRGWQGIGPRIVIECDGHQYHDASKDTAARDKSRDRELHHHVDKVLRFTGREINADPCGCADDALGHLHALWHRGFLTSRSALTSVHAN